MTSASAFRVFGNALVVILLGAALSGCGSSSGSSAGTTTSNDVGTTTSGQATALDGWARGLCQAVASWDGSVKATSGQIASSKADFASASQAITAANQALVASLGGLGTAPAPATTQAQNVIDGLSTSLQHESANISQALTGVRTQSEITKASTQVRASISKMKGDISSTVSKLKALPDQQGWKEAFRQPAACRTVANG